MAHIKVSSILKYRKLKRQKWIFCILVVVIVMIMCIFCADKLILEKDICDNLADISVQNQRDLLLSKNCLFKLSDRDWDKVNSADNSEIEINEMKSHNSKINNKTSNVNLFFRDDINDKKLAREIDKEVNDIVRAYVDSNNNPKAEDRNGTIVVKRELYSETPPDYDEFIKVVMNTRDHCTEAVDYNAIIAVHSAAYNFENRAAFRWLYGDPEKTQPNQFKLVFFIGLVKNDTLQDLLKKENEKFGDTVQGNFIDAYINMTYKAIMVFNWLDTHCKGMHGLFRVDDDVFMNINKVYGRWLYVQHIHPQKTLMCQRLKNDHVLRTGKWAVPRSLIPGSKYEFMRCPGLFAAITVDLIHHINVQSRKIPFFWIDDIVMLGLVPNAIGDVFFYPFNKWLSGAKHSDEYYACMKTYGPDCQYWVGITKIENFKTLYGYMSGSIPAVGADVHVIMKT